MANNFGCCSHAEWYRNSQALQDQSEVFVQQFQLNRVDLRRRIARDYEQQDPAAWTWLGGESRWLANIPLMYWALAAPLAGREFVQAPQPGEDFMESNRFAYWGSLLHLLTMNFGWQYPALGMRWWVDQGRPANDVRFALIRQTWASDGQFDAFLSYIWQIPAMPWPSFPLGPGVADPNSDGARMPSFEPLADRSWIRETNEKFAGFSVSGLHLEQGHVADWLNSAEFMKPNSNCELTLDVSGEPRGTLIAENLGGWYRYLHESEALQSDHPSGRSWRIDVVVKPVGYLGNFRRSRETGRWFAGPHSLHVVGNFS
jgi:hypothetical protein